MMQTPPPHIQIIQMGTGHWVATIVWAAAELGIADHVSTPPPTAAQLATTLGLHEHSTERFIRTLVSLGIFSLDESGGIHHTPLSEALRSDAPGSARSTIRVMTGQPMWNAYPGILHSLRTSGTAFEHHYGQPLFDYMSTRPELAQLFSESMVGVHGPEPPAIAEAYDFSGFKTIVDIGGATGNMLAHILSRYPEPKGVLYDLPHVTQGAPALLAAHGIADRVSITSGSFFEGVPEGGDAYILSHIIHDWNEDQCLTILGHCRRAMKPGNKLFIMEFVLPESSEPHLGKIADMVMLTMPGGEERTTAEYKKLLAKAGFQLNRVVPTTTPVSIVEAELA